jgi:hypothetical protein
MANIAIKKVYRRARDIAISSLTEIADLIQVSRS